MSVNKRIYLSPPHMSGSEQKYINEAFETNWVSPLGTNVNAFEESLADYCGIKYVAALNSGTAAIHLALILLGVKPGDEVIASTFTFSATINPIVYLGATPVLIDSETGTWNMDPDLLEQAIKGRRAQGAGLSGRRSSRIKAIIVVHLYGMPANMDQIMEIANKYEIPVIEDAAEALGSKYKGKQVGTFGKMGVISFNGNKIITTSGGGALISDDKELIEKAKFLASQARDRTPYYQHSQIGYNYRMSNILAGIGRGQIEVLSDRIRQRRSVNTWYREMMKDIPGIEFQTEPSTDFFSNYWLTSIVIYPEKSHISNTDLLVALEKENIESRLLWKPMHQQPVFANCLVYNNGISDELFAKGICLPSGSNISEEDRERVLSVIIRLLKK